MATFKYRAYDSHGVVKSGTIVAAGLEAAIDTLYGSGLTPVETAIESGKQTPASERTQAKPVARRFAGKRIGLSELAAFTAELASLVGSGVPLDASFRVLTGPGASPRRAELARQLLRDVLGGMQLSEAIAQRPDVFPPDYIAVLAGGEAGGQTAQALRHISDSLARRVDIRKKVRASLAYPAILAVMSLVSLGVIGLVLIPNLSPIFTDAGLPLPGILGLLAGLADEWPRLVLYAAIAGAAGLIAGRKLLGSDSVKYAMDRLACRLPVAGPLIVRREAGQFTRCAGNLIEARVPLMSALQIARGLVNNRYLRGRYGDAIERVPEGMALNQALDGTNLVPPASLRLLAVGEETGQLAAMLLRIANSLEDELQARIEHLVGLLTPLLTVGIGGLVGGLIMQVMSAVLSINNLAYQ